MRLSGGYGEVWMIWGGCLRCGERLSGGCGEAVWRMWGSCLDGVVRLSELVGRLSGGFREAVWRVYGGCLEGVRRLSRGCRKVVWMI